MGLCELVPQTHLTQGREQALRYRRLYGDSVVRDAPWGLNRAPYDFPPWPIGAPIGEELELGEEIVGEAPLEIQSRGVPSLRAAGCPEILSYSLLLADQTNGPAGTPVAIVSTPAIPTPAVIRDASVRWLLGTLSNELNWQLLLVDQEMTGLTTRLVGERLIEHRRSGTVNWAGPMGAYGPPLQFDAGGVHPTYFPYESLPIGRLLVDPGKRVAFAVSSGDGAIASVLAECLLTVEICRPTVSVRAAPLERVPAAPRAPAAPQAPAPRRAVAAPAPAPLLAPRPMFGTASGAYPVQRRVPGTSEFQTVWVLPDNPSKSYASQAAAQDAWDASQLAVTLAQPRGFGVARASFGAPSGVVPVTTLGAGRL